MVRWSDLDTKYRAALLTVVLCLTGATILVAISMTFNWHVHRATVENFMETEGDRTVETIEARIAECRAEMENKLKMVQKAQIQRIDVVVEAKKRLGVDWEDVEIRYFVMYGEPPE